MAQRSRLRYTPVSQVMSGFCRSRTPPRNSTLPSTGAMRMEKVRAPSRAKATVQAIGLNSRPSIRSSVKMGR